MPYRRARGSRTTHARTKGASQALERHERRRGAAAAAAALGGGSGRRRGEWRRGGRRCGGRRLDAEQCTLLRELGEEACGGHAVWRESTDRETRSTVGRCHALDSSPSSTPLVTRLRDVQSSRAWIASQWVRARVVAAGESGLQRKSRRVHCARPSSTRTEQPHGASQSVSDHPRRSRRLASVACLRGAVASSFSEARNA